jgi:hypothetical protein
MDLVVSAYACENNATSVIFRRSQFTNASASKQNKGQNATAGVKKRLLLIVVGLAALGKPRLTSQRAGGGITCLCHALMLAF